MSNFNEFYTPTPLEEQATKIEQDAELSTDAKIDQLSALSEAVLAAGDEGGALMLSGQLSTLERRRMAEGSQFGGGTGSWAPQEPQGEVL